jgi:hypothetical protein
VTLPPPAVFCTGGTRERFGDATCTPVTDCDAAFPPANATLFVDASLTHTDATHFRTIGEALAAASTGAVIAIEAGEYAEHVRPDVPVTLTGRCADRVTIASPDGQTSNGISAAVKGTAIRNLTVRGFKVGITAVGSDATIDGVVVEDSRTVGIFVHQRSKVHVTNTVVRRTRSTSADVESYGVLAQTASELTLEDSVVVDNDFVNVGALGAKIDVRRSIVRKGHRATSPRAPQTGVGGVVGMDGTLNIEESAFVDNLDVGVQVLANGRALDLRGSIVSGTLFTDVGAGVGVLLEGGTTRIAGTTLYGNGMADISAHGKAIAEVSDSTTIRDPSDQPKVPSGLGLIVSEESHAKARSLAVVHARNIGIRASLGGTIEVTDSLVTEVGEMPGTTDPEGAGGYGATAGAHSSLSMARSTIVGSRGAGLVFDGGSGVLDSVLVFGTESRAGRGGNGASVQSGGRLEATRCAFLDNRSVGVGVISDGTTLALRESVVLGTKADAAGAFGIGLFVAGGAATVEASTIGSSEAIGIALASATGSIADSIVWNNPVAAHAQDGTRLREATPGDEPPETFTIATSTQFLKNSTRLGSGTIPLPDAIGVK